MWYIKAMSHQISLHLARHNKQLLLGNDRCLRRLHTSIFRAFPRGAPKPDPSIKLKSTDDETKWKDFVNQKTKSDVPLFKEYRTVFGSVRMDGLNKVEYHGQQDDLEEHPANKDDSLSQGNFGEIQTSATSKSPRMISADSGDHLFFEELSLFKPVQSINFAWSKNPTLPEANNWNKNSVQSSSVKEYLSEIDEQYFGTLSNITDENNFPKIIEELPEKHSSCETVKDNESTKNVLSAKSSSNYIDQQFFGIDAPQDKVNNRKSKFKESITLKDESLSDLNYIDKQIIFGDENARTLASSHESSIKQDSSSTFPSFENGENLKPDKQLKIRSEVVTTKSKRLSKAVEIPQSGKDKLANLYKKAPSSTDDLQKEKDIFREDEEISKSKPFVENLQKLERKGEKKKKLAKAYEAKKGSALEFVSKIRKYSENNAQSSTVVSKTREQEISEIGVSLTRRISNVSRSTSTTLSLGGSSIITASNNLSEEDVDDNEDLTDGRVNPKFLPQNFSKMTSAEVEDIFQKSIIFDMHDIVGFYKPYGIEMFNDTNSSQHSIEKYLPCLYSILKTERLYQVHRLDKTTTGVILFAKTKPMQEKLVKLFRQRKIEKRYWAILNGTPTPSEGIINIPLAESLINDRYRISLKPDYQGSDLAKDKKWKKVRSSVWPAVTDYSVIKAIGNRSLVEVKPVTGFRHQIRAHLGLGLGTPILGDHKYSSQEQFGKPQKVHGDILDRTKIRFSQSRNLPIYLHAKRILIPEIVEGKELWIDAKLPHFFNATLRRLNLLPDRKID